MIRCLCSVVALLGLAFAALAVVRPGWATTVGLDLWNLPSLNSDLAEQEKIAANLEQHREHVRERITAKQEVLDELLAKRVTLMEAAAEFRHLDNTPHESPERGPDLLAGKTEGERYCREVLQWVRSQLEEEMEDDKEDIALTLEVELETYLSCHDGEVILTEK